MKFDERDMDNIINGMCDKYPQKCKCCKYEDDNKLLTIIGLQLLIIVLLLCFKYKLI